MKTALIVAVSVVSLFARVCYGNSVVENGTFDSNLTGWTVVGSAASQQGGRAVLSEALAGFNTVSIQQALVIPQGYVALRFDYWTSSDPEVGPSNSGEKDIFVAFLLEGDGVSGVPILPDPDPAGAGEFFNHENTPIGAQYPGWVSLAGNTVALDISSVTGAGDLQATLVFALGYWDNKTALGAEINFEVEIDNVHAVIPEPVTALAAGVSLTGLGNYLRRRHRSRG